MTDTTLDKIMELLETTIGLKPNSISPLVWDWILKERMKLSGCSTYREYWEKLVSSSHELQELIELLIVPETWFFRDRAAYDCLVDLFKNQWLNKADQFYFKILSLPCSTGEEPYSIAIALLEAGISRHQFRIDAADISKKALSQAEIGVYRKNAFRGKDLAYRERYFNKIDEGYALKPEVKRLVKFYYCNVLDEQIPFELASYQAIFCRNLLIYLDSAAQERTFTVLKKLLTDTGILFMGPAETQLAQSIGFISLSYNRAYAFYLPPKPEPSSVETQPLINMNLVQHLRSGISNLEVEIAKSQNKEKSSKEVDEKMVLIQEAAKLADSGCFEEATNLCLRYINRHGAHPQVYFLLGLMQHAVGHEERAEEFFQKTVYLEPTHYEALVYLALLYEKKGDRHKSQLFRNRAQRIYQLRS